MTNKKLSEEAAWFLKNLQRIFKDHSEEIGMAMVLINKKGVPIVAIAPFLEICKAIQSTKMGAGRCADCFKEAVVAFTSGKIKEPFFLNCHANFATMVWPVKIKGEIAGAAVGCGGIYTQKDKEKAVEAIKEIDVQDKEKVLKTLKEAEVLSKEELKKKNGKIIKLVEILAEETALGEVFVV